MPDGDVSTGCLILPTPVLTLIGLEGGDLLRITVRRTDGGSQMTVEPLFSRAGVRTVVEDRYGGAYSGGRFLAWPLPQDAIPAASQGSDVTAGVFWSEFRLCGRGSTPEAAMDDLDHQLASGVLESLVKSSNTSTVMVWFDRVDSDDVFRTVEDARRNATLAKAFTVPETLAPSKKLATYPPFCSK